MMELQPSRQTQTGLSVWTQRAVLFLILFLVGAGGPVSHASDFEILTDNPVEPVIRTWTSTSGSTVQAKLLRLEGSSVYLARDDGVEFRIPASKLSAQDIQYLRGRVPQAGTDSAPSESLEAASDSIDEESSKDAKEPTEDDLDGAYGIYEHTNFDAVTDSSGSVRIFLKDKGERLGRPIRLLGRITYRSPYRTSKVIELSPPEEIVRQPATITLRGKTVDNRKTKQEVEYEVTYSFEGNQVSAWGRSLGDGSYKEREMFEIMASIPATHDIPPSTEQPERVKILKDYSLELKGGDGGNLDYDFYTSPSFAKRTHKSANLIAPIWEPRKVSFSRYSKQAPLRPYVYPGNLLWQGFFLFIVKPDPRADEPSHKMVITID